MAACAVDTAIRSNIASGGKLSHMAILDNFCWCSSNEPTRLAELVDAVRACYEYAVGYGTPFISGKDSMFNDFKGYDENGKLVAISIPPTLLISSISVISDIQKTVSPEFKSVGDAVYIIGETHDELGASEYFKLLAKNSTAIGNSAPKVDWKKNKKTYQALENAIAKELVASSISLTSGGLVVALAKTSVGGALGAKISLQGLPGSATSIDAALFSESQGRILVTVAKKNISAFEKCMKGIAFAKIGTVSSDKKLTIKGAKGGIVVDAPLAKLSTSYHSFSNKNS